MSQPHKPSPDTDLIAKQSTPPSVYDRARALLESARSDLQSAQADEKAAEINL